MSVAPRYLRYFFCSFALWCIGFLVFTAFIDPYGVWATRTFKNVNEFKPARANLDRQIKPLEVLRIQPRTIFLGTSRAQQGLDPSVLQSTPFAPVYNAAVPAGTILENEVLLNHYLEIAPSIRHVVMEVFLYQMIVGQHGVKRRSRTDVLEHVVPLLFSSGTLRSSFSTLYMNWSGRRSVPSIAPDGHWLPPEQHDAPMSFNPGVFSQVIAEIHLSLPDMSIVEANSAALERMRDAAARHGARLSLLIAPNHPWDDYRLMALGYWDRLETMYRRLSKIGDVYSASPYNRLADEPTTDQLAAGQRMKYWYDPIHFGPALGREVLKAWGGVQSGGPDNLLVQITPDNVEEYLTNRRAGLYAWVGRNQTFVSAFERARRLYCVDKETCRRLGLKQSLGDSAAHAGELDGNVLRVDGVPYQLRGGTGGSIESVRPLDGAVIVFGWAIDDRQGVKPAGEAIGVAAVAGGKLLNFTTPSLTRSDISEGFGLEESKPAGFQIVVPAAKDSEKVTVRLFALTSDKYAVPISNSNATENKLAIVPFPAPYP